MRPSLRIFSAQAASRIAAQSIKNATPFIRAKRSLKIEDRRSKIEDRRSKIEDRRSKIDRIVRSITRAKRSLKIEDRRSKIEDRIANSRFSFGQTKVICPVDHTVQHCANVLPGIIKLSV